MNDEQTKTTVEDDARAADDSQRRETRSAHEPQARVTEDVRVSGDRQPESPTDGSLLPADQSRQLTSRWEEIQASFVDRPQEAVEQADALVADLMNRVTGGLTSERERLESQWASGEDVSTEDLRVALTRYRTFFDRLLSA